MAKVKLNRLQLEQLKDILKVQALKINTAPKSERKPNSDSPLFRQDNQSDLFKG